MKNMDTIYFGNSLRSIERGSGQLFQTKEALKMVFDVHSIRVFSQFSLDLYYEPLPWFMIGDVFSL